jgi:hypothetical protein
MKMKNNKFMALLAIGAFVYTGTSSAGVLTAQAIQGHEWTTTGQLESIDGQVTTPGPLGVTNSGAPIWVVPLTLNTTNTSYTGTQYSIGAVKTRLVSFNPNGSVFFAGTATTSSAIGSATVPTDGTLFSQSTLPFSCGPTVCAQGSTLIQVKVTF